jgi:hypothetical protein
MTLDDSVKGNNVTSDFVSEFAMYKRTFQPTFERTYGVAALMGAELDRVSCEDGARTLTAILRKRRPLELTIETTIVGEAEGRQAIETLWDADGDGVVDTYQKGEDATILLSELPLVAYSGAR